MLISTRGRYALRIMLELYRWEPGRYMPLPQIAQRQEISEKYSESIVSLLVRGGLVEGLRGKGGGYRLKGRGEECSLGQVLRLTEGSLAPVPCLEEAADRCPRAEICESLPVWQRLEQIINEYLDSVSLSDLAAQSGGGGKI